MVSQKKIVICGSVDDGKSSLIGRILFDTKNIYIDQQKNLEKISRRYGSLEKNLDLALLIDGLQDEREQGITIDVAHKFINFKNQRLIFCDSPGHTQYTKNVLTAASNCKMGLVLIDVTKGVLEQTLTHLYILDFVGIKNIIFAINKIDLIKNKKKFFEIKKYLENKILKFKFNSVKYIPTSATRGDNVVFKSKRIKWYKGNSILHEICKTKIKNNLNKFSYLSVQCVNRFNQTSRYYFGNINNAKLALNEKVYILPGKKEAKIKKIFIGEKNLKKMNSINSYVGIELDRQIDIVRGDVICKDILSLNSGDAFQARIVVTSEDKIFTGNQFLMRIHNEEVKATITKIKNKILFTNKTILDNKSLIVNDIADVELVTNEKIVFSTKQNNEQFLNFILIDLVSHNTVAAGKLSFALNRSSNIFKTNEIISSNLRSQLKNQKAICIWLTGLSGSGKTTLAKELEKKLYKINKHSYVLDGDDLRKGINKDLGFKESDRIENVRRVSEIAKIMVDAGLITIVSLISPFKRERNFAKSLFKEKTFFEVFVSTPLSVCEKRDVKGLYKKAKTIKGFNKIGISDNYEKPTNPFLEIDTTNKSIDYCVGLIFNKIFKA